MTPADPLPPRPSGPGVLVGVVRLAASLALLLGASLAILVSTLLPARPGRPGPPERTARVLCRMLLAVAGVRREVEGLDRLEGHHGFVFFNHVSYLDPVVLVALTPMRFLATAGARKLPLVGWIGSQLGTIWVHRGQTDSRDQARHALRDAVRQSEVPVALAPEGRIGPGPHVLPFRHGAFEVAADAQRPILLVALQFHPSPYLAWQDGEWLLRAYWRLCARTVPVRVRVAVLEPENHPPGDGARVQAQSAERVLNQRLLREA